MKIHIKSLKPISYLTLILLSLISNQTIAKTEPNIGIDYKIGINYVTHLYTLGNIGYKDVEYESKFGMLLSEKDKTILQEHKDLLKFGQGRVGKLTRCFFFIPAYLDLKTKEEYELYFSYIEDAIKNKKIGPVMDYFPNEKEELFSDEAITAIASVEQEFKEISQVYLRNINVYVKDIYPQIVNELENQKKYLNNSIIDKNILVKWQKVTNYTWNKGDYIFLLFRAGKNGPSFNNLSENINSCYYNIDEKYIVDMFSHEFGIFLMFDSIMPLTEKYKIKYPEYKNEYTIGRVDWMAFEMLSVFFNMKINDKKTMDYYTFKHSDPVAFMEIYSKLYEKGITNPKDLYCKGIEEYMKQGGYWNNGVKERYENIK